MASREPLGLAAFRWGRAARGHCSRRLLDQFSGGVVNRVASLLAVLVVSVNDLVPHDIVGPELGFPDQFSTIVVLIESLEPKLIVRPVNFAAGETAGFIENVKDFTDDLSLGCRRRRGGLAVRRVEVVGGAGAVGVHRNGDSNCIGRRRGWLRAEEGR